MRPWLAALDYLVCESVCVCDCDLVDCRTLELAHIWVARRSGFDNRSGGRIHRSTTEKYSARFFNYLIWWVRLRV